MTSSDPPTPSVSFREALWFWVKLGFISFGGPAGQISIMHQTLVVERGWLSEKRFLHALNYCMLLPGPEAQQLATYLGWLMHKTTGGILAGVLFVLPSLVLITVLSGLYVAYGQLAWMAALFASIKPAVVAIVIQAVHRVGKRALHGRFMWLLASLSFVAMWSGQVPFPVILLSAAGLALAFKRHVQTESTNATHAVGAASPSESSALINDHTPLPEHARFQTRRFVWVVLTGLLLWALPMGLLWWLWGPSNTLLDMGGFFSKAAWMTFGGAYAVLPYVYQGAVESFQWLSGPQMMDGLALGESTPGPLIMVVTFVGFLGGHAQPVLQGDGQMLSGVLGALVATWFTFLPSFVFILAGGPMVEMTHNQWRFTVPLSGITAAVVGVMLNLAVFFAYHVGWPQGVSGPLDWGAAALTMAWLMVLFRFKWSVLNVVFSAAALGLMYHLLRTVWLGF